MCVCGKGRSKRREEKPDYTGDEEFNFFLSVAFPDDELEIMDYNRVVKDLNGMSREEFLSSLSHSFDVEKVETQYKPTKRHTFGMLIENDWYKLSAKSRLSTRATLLKGLTFQSFRTISFPPSSTLTTLKQTTELILSAE